MHSSLQSALAALLAGGALLVSDVAAAASREAAKDGRDAPRRAVDEKVPAKATPFDLNQVQLLDGPFKRAQDLGRDYLLRWDVGLLLYPFLREAKLPVRAKGSDNLNYAMTGHMLGHYLSACAMLYRNTGDLELKALADQAVAVLAECQKKNGTGFVMGFPETKLIEYIQTGKAGRFAVPTDVSVPWYCLHKLYAGLLDMHLLAGNQEALAVLIQSVDWLWRQIGQFDPIRMETILQTEMGGMNEALANLHAITGRREHLELARRFRIKELVESFERGEDPLDTRHANARIPMVNGLARLYAVTGDPRLQQVALAFWSNVIEHRTYVTGGNCAVERFSPKAQLSEYVHDTTNETCNSYNMVKLARTLFLQQPLATYADYHERTLWNHILSAQNPQNGGMLLAHDLGAGLPKTDRWSQPNRDWQCCHGTGLESHVKYAEEIYFHDGAAGVFVNQYIASVLSWPEKGFALRQETVYPEQPSSRLIVTRAAPVELTLHLRHPWWCDSGFGVRINGQLQAAASRPSSYVAVRRVWRAGDTIDLTLPMALRTEGFKDNPRRLAVMYGPLVMAADTERDNRFSAIVSADGNFLAALQPGSRPLEFHGPGAVYRNNPFRVTADRVRFAPLLQFVDEPKIVYWDLCRPEEIETRVVRHFRDEVQRQRDVERQTVDVMMFGVADQQFGERHSHTFQGRLLGLGGPGLTPVRDVDQVCEAAHGLEIRGRKGPIPLAGWAGPVFPQGQHTLFRFVTGPAPLTFRMRVTPGVAQVLQLRLWRLEHDRAGNPYRKPGAFKVTVDEQQVGQCDVAADTRLGQYSDLRFPLPATLGSEKKEVRVTLASDSDIPNVAAGLYEARILRRE